MASSPPKKKISDIIPDEPTISRSGRVRKPKEIYDPSTDSKRRSLPIIDTSKSKKSAKSVAIEAEIIPDIESFPESGGAKKTEKVIASQEKTKSEAPATAGTINNRRKTICAVPIYDEENGCIVCDRSDIKKGRFVNCTGCDKRGHFTCLRNDKLYKTADQEHCWQCPTCKICDYCGKLKPNEQLYKCIICMNSYHLHCSSKFAPLPKSVVKKKFTCGICMKGTAPVKTVEPSKSLLVNRKSEGFPGFAHDDKPTQKRFIQTVRKHSLPKGYTSTSSKPSTSDHKDLNGININTDLNIKVEKKSPTPEQTFEIESNEAKSKIKKTLSVRTDLVPSKEIKPNGGTKPESDDDRMDIEYDTKTAITPHESIPDVRKWDCDEVYTYFMGKTTPEFAQLLKDNQIDGDALLLIKREDVLNRFGLKLGPALRLYSQVVALQYKNNNPILAWNEF